MVRIPLVSHQGNKNAKLQVQNLGYKTNKKVTFINLLEIQA